MAKIESSYCLVVLASFDSKTEAAIRAFAASKDISYDEAIASAKIRICEMELPSTSVTLNLQLLAK